MNHDEIYQETIRHFLGPIGPLLSDPTVTEIMIIGPSLVYFERKGKVFASDCAFASETALMSAVRNLAGFVGRPIGPAHPTLDGRLPDGSRVHVILPPASRRGICVTIRRFIPAAFELAKLVDSGTMSASAAAMLSVAVAMRKNILIAGGTGSGKTSLLSALTAAIPPRERIIVIEENSEIQTQRKHTVSLEARSPDDNGEGEMTVDSLFRNSLRMRPDRIIVGEVRGGEARQMIDAMVSGHPGGLGTIHANDGLSALIRLEMLCRINDASLPPDIARRLVALAINLVVHLAKNAAGDRKVVEIVEVSGIDPEGQYQVRPLYMTRSGSHLEPTGTPPGFAAEAVALGFVDPNSPDWWTGRP